jgi:hypothetical protein
MGNFGHKRVIRVWICEHGTDGEEDYILSAFSTVHRFIEEYLLIWLKLGSIGHVRYLDRCCRWS